MWVRVGGWLWDVDQSYKLMKEMAQHFKNTEAKDQMWQNKVKETFCF